MSKLSAKGVKSWRQNTKQRIVDSMGGKCVCCGYNECNAALELHHINPTDKKLSFGGIRGSPVSWARIVDELRKCILVCSNCHKAIEASKKEIPKEYCKFDESYSKYINLQNRLIG